MPATNGQPMGCSEHESPLFTTEAQLSRLYDALEDLRFALGDDDEAFNKVWHALPHDLKMDYNYARWAYRARRLTIG